MTMMENLGKQHSNYLFSFILLQAASVILLDWKKGKVWPERVSYLCFVNLKLHPSAVALMQDHISEKSSLSLGYTFDLFFLLIWVF